MVTFIVTKHNNVRIHDFITSFDVLAAGENNSNVTCRCSLLNHECSARNGGGICLQGYNVDCNDKDSSCD